MVIKRRNVFPLLQISPPNWKFLTKDSEEKERMEVIAVIFQLCLLSIQKFLKHLILIDSINIDEYLFRNNKVSSQKVLTMYHF